VERLFFANANHGARVRPIRATAQRDLVHDGGAINQPANHADIGPSQGGVIENGAVLGASGVQGLQHLVTAGSQGFSSAVKVKTMTAFVLYFSYQNGFALQAGCAADPVAFGQHADNFTVRVLADLPHQGLAVMRGHPISRLDLALVVDRLFKMRLFMCILSRNKRCCKLRMNI